MDSYRYTKEIPLGAVEHFFCDVLREECDEISNFIKHRLGEGSSVRYEIINPNDKKSWEKYPLETKECSRERVIRLNFIGRIKYGRIPEGFEAF